MADKTVRIIVKGVDEVSGVFDGIGKKIGGAGGLAGSLAKVGKIAGTAVVASVAAAGAGVAAFGAAAIKGAISYESAFAGVTKTTDGLVDSAGMLTAQGEEMRKAFLDLSTVKPITPEALAGIGELGGQLGIQKENLIDFTGVIADLAVATNLTEDQAATSFARMANVMGTPQDAFDRMGSSVVALGNNFATTESDIVAFANRIAGAGKIVGLSEADVFGISTAFSSVGVEAEAGGTAVQKALLKMNEAVMNGGDNLETFALTAGLSSQEFAAMWEKDAAGAFSKFVQGLGLAGDDAAGILDLLGLSDQRLLTAFLKLGNAGDLVSRAIKTSNVAWKENTALSKEAEQRYNTTESQIQLLKNTFGSLTKQIGLAFLPTLKEIIKNIRGFVTQHGDQFVEIFVGFGKGIAAALPKVFSFVSMLLDLGKYLFGVLEDGDTLNDWLTHLPAPIQGAVKAFGQMVDFLRTTVIKVWGFLVDLWKSEVVGAGRILASFWENVLLPTLIRIWNFLQTSIIPIFNLVVDWLRANLPHAIDVVAGFIADTLIPMWGRFTEFVQNVALPILSKIFDWLKEKLPIALQFASDLWQNTLLPAIGKVSDFIQNTLIPAFNDINAWLNEKLPQILDGFFGKMESGFSGADPLITAFSDAWTLIKDSVGAALDVIGPALVEWWGNFQEGFKQFAILGPTFAEFWEAIKPIVIGAALVIGAAFAGLMAILSGLEAGAAKAIKPFLTTIAFLVNGVVKLITGVVNFISGSLSFIVGLFTGNGDLMAEGWERAWKGIEQITEGLIFSIVGTIFGAIQTIGAWIEGFTQGVIDFFNALYDALVGGSIVPDLVNQILFLFGSLKDGALGILNELVKGAINLGSDLVSGLAGAIESGVGTVTGAIGGLLNNAINTAKKTLKTGSPSKVFMGFGEDIGTGLTAGMQSMMSAVQNQAQGMTSFGGMNAMTPAAVGAGGGGPTINNFYIDGVRVSSTSTGAGNAEDQALIMLIDKIRRQLQLSR